MASFLPSSIQKRLLRYALLKTGLLETQELDLDSLDITLGRQNTVELRDVGLHVQKLSSLLELPPEVRLEAARVVRLKLSVPADLYYGSIAAEAHGIECRLSIDPASHDGNQESDRARGADTTRSPRHRKTYRRIGRSPPYDPGGNLDDDEVVPTTQDLARSFLMEEPREEVHALEERYTSQAKRMAESNISETSDDAALGTGNTPGLPGFLAGFLQGIVDRFQFKIFDVTARLSIPSVQDSAGRPKDSTDIKTPVTIMLKVENVDIGGVAEGQLSKRDESQTTSLRRHLTISNIRIFLEGLNESGHSQAGMAPLEEPGPKIQNEYTAHLKASQSSPPSASLLGEQLELPLSAESTDQLSHPRLSQDIPASPRLAESQRSLQSSQGDIGPDEVPDPFDIRLGEDNTSWNYRRSESGTDSSDVWSDRDQPTDLAASVLADRYLSGSAGPQSSNPVSISYSPGRRLHMPGSFTARTHNRDDSASSEGHFVPSRDHGLSLNEPDPMTTALSDVTAGTVEPLERESENQSSLDGSQLSSEDGTQSMYMSAYSTEIQQDSHQLDSHPGQFFNPPISSPAISASTETLPVQARGSAEHDDHVEMPDRHLSPAPVQSGANTPTNLAARSEPSLAHSVSSAARQILQVDQVDVWLQSPSANVEQDQDESSDHPDQARQMSTSSVHGGAMPGAFSVYAEQSASVRFDDPNMRQSTYVGRRRPISSSVQGSVDVEVSSVRVAFEIGMLSEYVNLGKALATTLTSQKHKPSKDVADSEIHQSNLPITILLSNLSLDLVSSEAEYWKEPGAQGDGTPAPKLGLPARRLVSLQLLNTEFAQSSPSTTVDWSLNIRSLNLLIGNQKVLSFSDKMLESKRSIQFSDADIYVDATTSLTTLANKRVTQYNLQTKQIEFALAFDNIEDTFSSYGGLSSLLELSASIGGSDSHPTLSPPPSRKGVRFQDSPVIEHSESEMKVNARLGGISAIVSGRVASINLATSAVKVVARSEYIAAAVDHVQLTGPLSNLASNISKPVGAVLNGVRFEYLFHPKDADLERLLSLLTPSKNKYENDDDILLDTLLRQRRKGAVIRLNIAAVRGKIEDWIFLESLQSFSDELASLSAVTKYLPEDERPGILTLVRVQDIQFQMPVNETFGALELNLQDTNVAQIGLPSLVAFAVGTIRAGQKGRGHLVHPLMALPQGEDLPMVMARMIGDEVEPTMRLKLFNVCLEYSIPTFLALTGFGADIKAEQVIDLAASTVIDLTAAAGDGDTSPSSLTSSTAKQPKKLSIDLLFHECMVGLQPQGLESKVMMVLNNAKVTTIAPPKDVIKASIELRKASIFVADRVETTVTSQETVRISPPQRLLATLEDSGYVSVSSIMTARVDIQVTESADKTERSVELDVRNELFLLETCADSTQTLIKTLSALAPPAPPSKEQKFRVEAMTMDEMVSSFTGDAFAKPASPPSTIFDMEGTSPPDDDELIDASMSESLYGGLDALEDPGDDLLIQDEAPGHIAESLLDEDPFEIPDNPHSAKLNNRDLMKTLNEQLSPNIDGRAVELKPFLLTSQQLDRLPGESAVLGAPYRWNTPKIQHPTIVTPEKQRLPFKLRVRDVHVIWNLYDGYDWQGTRQAISQAVEEVEIKAEERRMKRKSAIDPDDEESIIGDCLFNSIYIGVPASKEAQDLRRQINKGIDDLASETESYATSGLSKPTNQSAGSGQRARRRPRRLKLERSKAHKVAFELRGVSADVLVFPPGVGETQNSVDLRVRDVEVFDNLPTSTWRKFMTSWHKDDEEREIAKPMAHIELMNVRPVKELSATELVLCVTVTPIRLHVDQDALDFMTRFFEFKDSAAQNAPPDDAEQPFLQRVEVHTVDLSLDYKPKRVDYAGLRSGRYTEFKNFFILDAAHVVLKHTILYGIRGFDVLHDTLNDIWMPDIKRNQLPGVLSGLATVSPLVNLGAGFAEVVAVPIREYRKDGRVVRSIQKGAVHLMRNTTGEIARFGARVAVGTQNVLTGAETMLSPAMAAQGSRRSANVEGWTDLEDEEREERAVSSYANQPLGVLQGLKSARRHLERDLLMAKDAIIAVQGEVMDSGSASAAAQAVVRHAPTIMLRPVIGASRAVGQTLMGVGNQVDRGYVRKIEDKYKQR